MSLPSIVPVPPLSESLREWWHEILRNYGRYACCAVILALPSDTNVITYLNEFSDELDLLSGENCLVIALTNLGVRRFGFDGQVRSFALNEHIAQGHSLHVAKLLNIKFTEFPCLALFDDIRSPDYVIVSLKGLDVGEIALKLRTVFVIVQDAITQARKPIAALERQQKIDGLRQTSRTIFDKLFNVAGKTFEKALEAWISAAIK